MMYLLCRYKNGEPSRYFEMPESDKRITRLFMEREIGERIEEMEALKNG